MIDQNLADTLNKALDLAKQGAVAGFEMVKQAAPYVWSLALRQTIIDGIEYAFFALMLYAIAAIYLPKLGRWAYRESDIDGLPWAGFGFVACSLLVPATFFTVNAIDLIGNPGYWTIQKILEMAKPHQ